MGAATVLPPGPSRLITAPGVYAPQYDSGLLAHALSAEDITVATDVLDLGTGTGCFALCAARRGARVTAVGISRRAVLVTRVNVALEGLRVTVRRGDRTDAVRSRAYDLVVSNPPYVPSPAGLPSRGAARAWEAGPDGRAVVDRICDAAPRVVRPGGVLLMVHHRGFAGVPEERECDLELRVLREELEQRFLDALYADVPTAPDTERALAPLLIEPAGFDPRSVSHHLEREGGLSQLRVYAALRSLYHLKEADPHAWVLPRLHGRAKAGMAAAIEYDEFGAGPAEEIHARLFADLMTDLGLDTTYGRYLDAAPAQALATARRARGQPDT